MRLPKKVCGVPFPFAILIGLALSYAVVFGKPTSIVWRMRKEAAENPRLSIVPVPLPNTSISQESGATVEFFGYDFEVPWQDAGSKQEGAIAMVSSKSNRAGVIFFDPASESGIVKLMKETPGGRPEYLYPLYGKQNAKSEYDLAHATLNSSPSQLSLIFPWSKEVYAANLLLMKEVYTLGPGAALYSFQFGHFRGFQQGNPERDKRVEVQAYDAEDRKFRLVFSSDVNPKGVLKQTDINRVLQTLHPAPGKP
jgi:hypothetical protein